MSSLRAYHAGAAPQAVHDPVHGGAAILSLDSLARYMAGDKTASGVGTVGLIASDTSGKKYIVTAMHNVVNKSNVAKIGDQAVYLTGTAGKPQTIKVGSVAKMGVFKPLSTNAPASSIASGLSFDVVLLTPLLPVSYNIPGIGLQKAHVEPRIGMRVKKSGYATGVRLGTVVALPKVVSGYVCGMISPQVLACLSAADLFAVSIPGVAGDSGGPVVSDTGQAVGITIIGGNPSVCIKASAIARRFGVSFAPPAGYKEPAEASPVFRPGGGGAAPIGTGNDPIAALIQLIIDFINSIISALSK